MEFLTIQALAKQFGLNDRNCRNKVLGLLQKGEFKEPEDIRKDNVKDNNHFRWLVNPVSFTKITGLQPLLFPSGNKPDTKVEENSNEVVEILKAQLKDKDRQIERLEKTAERHVEDMQEEKKERHTYAYEYLKNIKEIRELDRKVNLLESGRVVTPPVTNSDTKENGRSKTDNQSVAKEAEVVSENGNEDIPK